LIKTLITLVIVAVVLNATYHAGVATWRHFKVRDEAQQLILFGGRVPTSELEEQIAFIAQEVGVPINPEDIIVSREGPRTIAEAYYTMPVELFPRFFYPIDLSFTVEAFALSDAAPLGR
jgi:hypothetical protein